MKTVGEVLELAATFLKDKKIERGRREAEDLLGAVLEIRRIDLYMQIDRPLEPKELDLFREHLKRKGRGEPFEYIVGSVEFYGAKIQVDPRVLIPRPETEIMADLAAKRIEAAQGSVLWDLCTGSGCLGISLKKRFPALKVALSDLSKEALGLAAENGRINGVEVELLQGDLLAPFQGRRADFVLCNPPYISKKDFETLESSVKDFEPKGALVGGERGDEFYERLARDLPFHLNPGAQVFLEIGWDQGAAVKKIFSGPEWRKGELLFDWAGKERFFFLEKQ